MTRDRVGTLGWFNERSGALRPPCDQMIILGQAVALLIRELPAQVLGRLGLSVGRLTAYNLARLSIPNTVASREAQQTCHKLEPSFLVNHCFRTYVWANILAAHDNVSLEEVDDELLYVSCLLHDLGLSRAHTPSSRPGCFTFVGARQLRHIGTLAGWEQERIQAGEEAIYLHMNPRVSMKEGVEAHLLTRGSQLDAIGIGYWRTAKDTRDHVFRLHPRGFGEKKGFSELFDRTHHAPKSRARLYYYFGSRWWFRLPPE